jgi:hypothetical protein
MRKSRSVSQFRIEAPARRALDVPTLNRGPYLGPPNVDRFLQLVKTHPLH